MITNKQLAMRLAFRHEGEFVNCYHAQMGTMEGSMLLGSMRASLLLDPKKWNDWRDLMQSIYYEAIRNVTGQKAEMISQPAPEHERAGRA